MIDAQNTPTEKILIKSEFGRRVRSFVLNIIVITGIKRKI